MDSGLALSLRRLLTAQSVASLGTLHEGEPYVSMVPFAWLPDGSAFVIHVSGLAAHTADMLRDPRVSLMVMDRAGDASPQALARVTIQADAAQYAAGDEARQAAAHAYLARFPQSAMTFELPDFSLFALRPRAVRFVGGFAQAKSLTPETLSRVLRHP